MKDNVYTGVYVTPEELGAILYSMESIIQPAPFTGGMIFQTPRNRRAAEDSIQKAADRNNLPECGGYGITDDGQLIGQKDI